jgi:hypothetical protein
MARWNARCAKLGVARRVFNVVAGLALGACIQSLCPRGHQTFFLFLILDIFVRTAESNHLHARCNNLFIVPFMWSQRRKNSPGQGVSGPSLSRRNEGLEVGGR